MALVLMFTSSFMGDGLDGGPGFQGNTLRFQASIMCAVVSAIYGVLSIPIMGHMAYVIFKMVKDSRAEGSMYAL